MHLVGLIIRIYHDARSSECKKKTKKIFAYPNKCGTGNQFLIILETVIIREILYLAQSMCIVYNKRYAYFVQ